MTEPMMLSVIGSDASHRVDVVRLTDGRLGFLAPDGAWSDSAAPVVLTEATAGAQRRKGAATVARSGPAYEEVRGRLRAEAGRWQRWRLRGEHPVVLVTAATSADPA